METSKYLNALRLHEPADTQELVDECDAEEGNYLKNSSSVNRSCTDVWTLMLHGVLLFVLIFFLRHFIINGDVDRLTKGYDDCGNVCGKQNDFPVDFLKTCRPQDMTDKPLLSLAGMWKNRECVKRCGNKTISDGYRCISKKLQKNEEENQEDEQNIDVFMNFFKTLHVNLHEIVLLSLIALAFTCVILFMLLYTTTVCIWLAMFGIPSICVFLLVFYGSTEMLGWTIFWVVSVFVMCIPVLILRKKNQFIVQLFEQARKCFMIMPGLLFEPILTFISLATIWSAWFYFTLWIVSAGIPHELFGTITFQPTNLMYFVGFYNLFMMLWMVQFICNCQNMLVAGAISTWYFTRNKNKLNRPICNSANNMVNYHLGSVSLTSLMIAVIKFAIILLLLLRRSLEQVTCFIRCLVYVEYWMKYGTMNSCIITAMHGYAFRKAAKRALKLILDDLLQVIAIIAFSDLVLISAKLLVASSTMIVGILIIKHDQAGDKQFIVLLVVGIMAYMIADCFFSVYEVAINTIFICFCEDREVNDGVSRPYFMPDELMEFAEKSKHILKLDANHIALVNTALSKI